MSSSWQTRTGTASRGFKRVVPFVGARRPDLPALGDEDHVAVGLVAVHEMAEAFEDLGRLDRLPPLAFVALDMPLHRGLELRADAETVLAHHFAQVVDAALEVLQPGAGALQPVGG